jgi:hypothetical protein
MPDPPDEDFRPLEEDEDDETTTRSFPLPRADVGERLPTHLDGGSGMDDFDEDEPTERSHPHEPRGEAGATEVDGLPRFVDDDESVTEVNEVAVSLADSGDDE